MKSNLMGQKSPWYAFVSIFSSSSTGCSGVATPKTLPLSRMGRFLGAILMALLLSVPKDLGAVATKSAKYCYGGQAWSVSIHLGCPMNAEANLSRIALYSCNENFAGFSDDFVVQDDGESLTFFLSGPTSLPPARQIAIITVTNPDCNKTQQWMVRSDGGGSILIIDSL